MSKAILVMEIFQRHIISKSDAPLLAINIFCCFVLCAGESFDSVTGIQKDITNGAFSCLLKENHSALISDNRKVFGSLKSAIFEKEGLISGPRNSKEKSLLLTSIKHTSQKSFHVRNRYNYSLNKLALDSFPALRI